MKLRWALILMVLVIGAPSCSRDPNVAKRKYLESGNRYFEKGKYREASIMYRSALRKDARYGEAYYRLGLTLLKLGQPGVALRQFTRAFELLPDSPDRVDTSGRLTDLYLAQFLLDTRRSSNVRNDVESFLKNPKVTSFDRLRLEAHVAWRDRKMDEAIQKFEEAHRQRPRDRAVGLALVQAYLARGEMESDQKRGQEAGPWFEKALKLSEDVIAQNQDFGPIYDVVYSHYMRHGQPEEAEKIRRRQAENNPRNLDYQFQLAAHYLTRNQPQEAERVIDRVVADKRTFPNGREKAGDFYMINRQYEKAIEYYQGGLGGTKEEWLNFQRKIADAMVAQGKRDEALHLLDQVILKRYPNDAVAQALRASLWIESGDRSHLKQAISELESALQKMPKNPVLRYNLGRAYWARGDLEPARVQFRAALDIQADYLPPRQALCELHFRKGDYAAALQLADEILSMDPGNFVGRMLRSQTLQALGKRDEARKEIQELIARNPGAPGPMFGLGMLEMNARNYAAAASAFSNCLSKFPGQTICTLGLAEAYTGLGQPEKAVRFLSEELKKDPGRREFRLGLGNALVQSGKYTEAAQVFKDMLAKEPNSADLHMRLAEAYRRAGNYDGAIEQFRVVKQLQPTNADAHVWLALLLHTAGRQDEAREHYKDILRLQPDNPIALNNLAFVIAEENGDLDVALTYAQQARQKLPDVPEVADTLGWIYIKKKLTSNALAVYDDLVNKYPTNPTFRYHRGVALLQKGDRPGAKKELETALRYQPQAEEKDKIRELLAKIG